MELTSRQHGVARVVTLSGRITGDDGVILRQALADIHAQGHRFIVVDVAELEYLDSAGLGELVACQLRAIRHGTPLRLANPDRRLQDLLVLTRLLTVFETYNSLDDAIESFEPPSQFK